MHTEKSQAALQTVPILDPLKWVSLHADYLYSYTVSRVNNEDEARDLVQDTFLSAVTRTICCQSLQRM